MRVAWCCLLWKNESATDRAPGGSTQPTASEICCRKPSVLCEASRTEVITRNAGNSVRMDEYAAPFATENCPCWKACQKARRSRVKCMKTNYLPHQRMSTGYFSNI